VLLWIADAKSPFRMSAVLPAHSHSRVQRSVVATTVEHASASVAHRSPDRAREPRELAMTDHAHAEPPEFSITAGPFNRLARHLHLADASGSLRAWRLAGIAWLPLLLDSIIRYALQARVDP